MTLEGLLAMGHISQSARPFSLFALETFYVMILNMHGTTVPPHHQRQHINCELITCKGKENVAKFAEV